MLTTSDTTWTSDNSQIRVDEKRWADCDDLRTSFTLAISAMYRSEVPLYGDLVRIISDINSSTLQETLNPEVLAMRSGNVTTDRLDIERHGAIRLGTPKELETIRAVFGILGLFPVGYYDLSIAGLPIHATCFRPITQRGLHKNPFRVFTSLLRPELIEDTNARELALKLLNKRQIFSDKLLSLLGSAATQHGRLTVEQSPHFIAEAIKIFQWQGQATATTEEYSYLKAQNPILADIACFGTSHINHLTPRTLNIIAAQQALCDEGIPVKERIEGPPPRACPILLRQTSFLAVEERICFGDVDFSSEIHQTESNFAKSQLEDSCGLHRARFGEVEERGAAVTPAGRELYDALVKKVMMVAKGKHERSARKDEYDGVTGASYDDLLAEVFREYPDDWEELRKRRLVYFTYQCAGQLTQLARDRRMDVWPPRSLDKLLQDGIVKAVPMTYEDFLPLSAAGIFQSNLGTATTPGSSSSNAREKRGPNKRIGDQKGMEVAMQARILDLDEWYRFVEAKSIEACSNHLGVRIVR